MKLCRYCQTEKPLEAFSVRRASPDGRSYKCRECGSAYARAKYAADPSSAKARARDWAKANPERRREIQRAFEEKSRERIRAKNRAYQRRVRLEKPDVYAAKNRAAAHTRRSRVSGAMDSRYVADLLARADGVCVYCLAEGRPLTVDHMIAVAAGGGNGNENLAPCCKSCNSSKNDSPIDDWLMRRHGVLGIARAVAFLEGNPIWRSLA